MMSNTATFTLHIINVVSVPVAVAFSHADALEVSWYSLIRVLLPALESIAIQRTFTYETTEVQHLNYWERLHKRILYSIERRRNRYIITYIWKITQHTVPNIDGIIWH